MRFAGTHVMGEMHGVASDRLKPDVLEAMLTAAIASGGGTLIKLVHHCFDPQGLTLLAVLAESHASIHTFPEHDGLFFDIFTCGSADPEQMADTLVEALQPKRHSRTTVHRGQGHEASSHMPENAPK